MRSALLTALLFAFAAAAQTELGPISIEQQPGVTMLRDGTYFEYRFHAINSGAEPHRVRIEVASESITSSSASRASRTVVVAPRSSVMVSIPEYVMNQYESRAAHITVDGRIDGKIPLSMQQGASYRTSRDVLLGRSVSDALPPEAAHEDSGIVAIRPPVAPSSWSANWLHYTPFSSVMLTPADWNELSPPVRTALLRWVSVGGSLTFVGTAPAGLPSLRPVNDFAGIQAGAHGFGWIAVVPEKITAEMLPVLQSTWRPPDIDTRHMWYQGAEPELPMPLLDDESLPIKSLFSMLLVFAVIGGPVNLWVLAKKQRRLWIFWTLPLFALVTSVVLVGAVIFSEGWVRIQRSTSLTLLDERLGEAATLGWTGFYATLAPDDQVRFDSATEVRPMFLMTDGHTDWSDGQRFVAGWIGSRLPRGFALRKVEPRRERVPIRREGGHLVAVNGLGASIAELWVAEPDGTIHVAKSIPAGKEVVLTRRNERTDPAVRDPAHLFASPSMWASYHGRFSKQPLSVLRPGTYVAVVERSPFVETALEKTTRSTAESIVIGFMKGIDDAS